MGVTRRSFVSLVVGGAVGTLLTPIPWKLTDDVSIWSQNWPWIPRLQYGDLGKAPALSKSVPGGMPVNVVTVDGRPVTTQGNPENPLSRGGLNILAAGEVQMLYSPARVTGPKKKAGEGAYEDISWDDALALLAGKLKGKPATAAVSGDENGTVNEVLGGLLAGLGSKNFFLMPCEAQLAARGWEMMRGTGLPGYDIENADFVLFIGPDAFESWGPSVRNAAAMGAARPMGEKPATTFAYAGPVCNQTGATSDAWIAVLPGGEAAFALSLAAELVKLGAGSGAEGFGEYKALAAKYDAAKAQQLTGVAPATVAALAKAMSQAKKPLVIPGSTISQGGSPAAFVAGMGLNLLLDRVNKPGGVRAIPALPPVVANAPTRKELLSRDFVKFLLDIESGKQKAPEVLITYEANPYYGLPQAGQMAAALDKIPFKVSFASYMHETAAKADLILPNAMAFERFDDLACPYGAGFAAYCVGGPVVEPVVNAMPAAEVLLALAPKVGVNLGFGTFLDVLKAKAETLGGSDGFMAGPEAAPWTAIAEGQAGSAGDVWDDLIAGKAWVSVATESQPGLSFAPQALAKGVAPAGPSGDFGLLLAPRFKLKLGTASTAVNPYALTTIEVAELDQGVMGVAMCSATAEKAGVGAGAMVKVTAPKGGEVTARVVIDETVMPGVVAADLGFGHTAFDKASRNMGDNVYKLLTVTAEAGSETPVWNAPMVKIAKS